MSTSFQLYHACDQDVFSFCLMKYTVLQFCDFYTATMAYWVTVLAMGGLPEQAKSLLHMVGAIGVAMAIEYDRTGVFTFLVPAVVGIFVLVSAWVSLTSIQKYRVKYIDPISDYSLLKRPHLLSWFKICLLLFPTRCGYHHRWPLHVCLPRTRDQLPFCP